MKQEILIRITVADPPAGVWMKVQKGKDELLEPVVSSDGSLRFDLPIDVDLSADSPNFLGKFAQGPKDARFIYVNSGTYAGQHGTCWSRRAKLSLASITTSMVEAALASPDGRLETKIKGTGTDGGPVCASIKGLRWEVTAK